MVRLERTKRIAERLAVRRRKGSRKRRVIALCIGGTLASFFGVLLLAEYAPWIAAACLLALLLTGGVAIEVDRRGRFRRRRYCPACRRDSAMERVGRRRMGYLRMRCRYRGLEKTGSVEEESWGDFHRQRPIGDLDLEASDR